MAKHRKPVETALMKKMPRAVRSSIRAAASMDTLDLSDRGLIGLPDSIGRLSPRKRVDLSGNDLPSLPKGIGQWTAVREMDLSDNRLGCVPQSIGRLSRLEELDLSGNRLTELPESIAQLDNLRRLDLRRNDLSELPGSIGQLPDITNVIHPKKSSNVRWRQTARLEVELRRDGPLRVLLDSLTSVLVRRDSLTVRRSPAQPKQSLSELRSELINQDAIGLSSASHARIDYTFLIANFGGEVRFEEEIEAVQFFFRKEFEEGEDIPILYVDGQRPWVQDVLEIKFKLFPKFPYRSFKGRLVFVRLAGGGSLFRIGGRDVREGFEREKRQFIQKIRRLTYDSY